MIVHVDDGAAFLNALRGISGGDPFACRILSLCQSYRPGLPFVDYWLVTDESGCTGAAARNGSCFTVYLTEQGDGEELSSFLHMAGASVVLCDGRLALEGFPHVKEGIVMRTDSVIQADGETVTPNLRDFYALLTACADEDFTPPPFEDFYVDVNHRLRHGTARAAGVIVGGTLAAAAMTVAESDSCAVLGAVACHPLYRRQGLGTIAVAALVNSLLAEGKTVYLHRAANKNAAFYAQMGFADCGTWHEYSIME